MSGDNMSEHLRAAAIAWQKNPMLHPWTCNGGNPNFQAHHDHEVLLLPLEDRFECPECGRQQMYGPSEVNMLTKYGENQ